MDNRTFQRHMRLTRQQFERFVSDLEQGGMALPVDQRGGPQRVPVVCKALAFLWYMGNQNSFREISDKFLIAQSTAHDCIIEVLGHVCQFASRYIKWPNRCEKNISSGVFSRITHKDRLIGAIDGCHIRIQRPRKRGLDYMNRKGFYSILLQGTCDDQGKFIDIFVGPPGRVHDARMLRLSPLFQNWQAKMDGYFLLGDSAYIGNNFKDFIITPKRDNGRLTDAEHRENTSICKGRVIIENAFGRMKCRYRRLRELQNFNLDIIVKIVVAACTLHNMCMEDFVCEDHPDGCPRDNDDNECECGSYV